MQAYLVKPFLVYVYTATSSKLETIMVYQV